MSCMKSPSCSHPPIQRRRTNMHFLLNKVLGQNSSSSPSISHLLSSPGALAHLFILAFLCLSPLVALAQWPYGSPTTPDAQRNALSVVRSQVGWLDNDTRTAPNFGAQGADNVWQQFQAIRGA